MGVILSLEGPELLARLLFLTRLASVDAMQRLTFILLNRFRLSDSLCCFSSLASSSMGPFGPLCAQRPQRAARVLLRMFKLGTAFSFCSVVFLFLVGRDAYETQAANAPHGGWGSTGAVVDEYACGILSFVLVAFGLK